MKEKKKNVWEERKRRNIQEGYNGRKWEVEVRWKVYAGSHKQAQKAYAINETPIGCVIVYEGKIIGRGYNRRNTDKDPLAHAEIKAIKKASKKMGDWRLEQCTMYVTLEPCQMCAGAIIQSRLTRVVVGCMNPKAGCAGSVLNLLDIKQFNHQAELTTGVLEEECSALMTGFFRELREKNRRKR